MPKVFDNASTIDVYPFCLISSLVITSIFEVDCDAFCFVLLVETTSISPKLSTSAKMSVWIVTSESNNIFFFIF